MKKKVIALVAALSLVAAVGAGSTLAYLTDTTDAVVNTFTVGTVNIELSETADANGTAAVVTPVMSGDTLTGYSFTNLTPGDVVNKAPVVTVMPGSLKSYVFVEVSNTDENLTLTMNTSAWTQMDNSNIYYCIVDAVAADAQAVDLPAVFTQVTVSTAVSEKLGNLNDISVKAYAVQFDNVVATEGKTAVEVAKDIAFAAAN